MCFAMRLLHADLPHLNGRSQETLDRLYYILAVVRKVFNGYFMFYSIYYSNII